MTDTKWQVCAVCGYVLEHQSKAPWWIHVRPEDHTPVPVDAEQIHFKSRCDFCDQDSPQQMVLAKSFPMPDGISRSIGPWAACDTCCDLVKRERWSALITRVKQSGGPGARTAPRSILSRMYAALAPNIVGYATREDWLSRQVYPFPSE